MSYGLDPITSIGTRSSCNGTPAYFTTRRSSSDKWQAGLERKFAGSVSFFRCEIRHNLKCLPCDMLNRPHTLKGPTMKTAARQIASTVGLSAVLALIAAAPLSAQIRTQSAYTSPFCMPTSSVVPDELKAYCDRERERLREPKGENSQPKSWLSLEIEVMQEAPRKNW